MPTNNFQRLIGVWKTEGVVIAENGNLELQGTDSYELILDGKYILHKANVKMGEEKNETFEMMSLVDSLERAGMHYFNSKGESGVMTGYLEGNNFVIEGDRIKFKGSIDDMNTKIVGKWYLQPPDNEWTEFIYITLTKQN
jgi:hypothetical protein